MTKNEFYEKVENGSEIMFVIGKRGFTILNYYEDGPDIGEWNKPETVKKFKDVTSLLEQYTIDQKPLKDYVNTIRITDYS